MLMQTGKQYKAITGCYYVNAIKVRPSVHQLLKNFPCVINAFQSIKYRLSRCGNPGFIMRFQTNKQTIITVECDSKKSNLWTGLLKKHHGTLF